MPRGGRRDAGKEKYWQRMVRGQARSGLSIRAWCRARDLQEPAFYWWRARLGRTDRSRKARSRKPTLIPVRVSAQEKTDPEWQIEIVLAGDRRIRVRGPVDRPMLADVLAMLEAWPC